MTDIWYCGECELVLRGTPKEVADQHLFLRGEPDWWSHWLWGFKDTEGNFPYNPTGEEIHTSDAGGFYLSNFMKPAEVWERLARTRFNLALRRERT